MTAKNQATVSYKETTTISPDGKITRQQETKVVGDPSSPEVSALMEKVSDKGSRVGEIILVAGTALVLGGGLYLNNRRKERVINPEMVEEIKQRSKKSKSEGVLAFVDNRYTAEEKQRARKELDEAQDSLRAQIREFKQKYGDI